MDAPKVRPAGVAGGFYPADPKELTQMIDGLLAHNAVPQVQGPLVALICPHAGYMFTGPVAAACFAQLKGRKYTRVVVIAPSHYVNFPFSSIYDGDAYATPLGQCSGGQGLSRQAGEIELRHQDLRPRPRQGGARMPSTRWKCNCPGSSARWAISSWCPSSWATRITAWSARLGRALAKALLAETPEARAQTLILVSSDLSHYHPYDYANNVDHQTLQAIEDWDYLSLSRNFAMWERGVQTWEACGGGPIVAGMIAAEGLGATHAQILKYANSGDTTGEKTRVVGYGAVAITPASAAEAKKSAEFSLTGREKDALMKIARASVETAVRDRKMYLVGSTGFPRLEEARGAFVTLKEHGELRGCIGYITPMKSLAETVRDVAAYAALEDSRFTPVTAKELPLLEYEVSVMSPLRRVLDIKEIKVGKHGLIMKQGDIEGILLPQVPVEEHWDRDTFIEETCLKAGLPRQAWKDDDTDIFMFTALVFGEHSPEVGAFPERPSDQPTAPTHSPSPSPLGQDSPRP